MFLIRFLSLFFLSILAILGESTPAKAISEYNVSYKSGSLIVVAPDEKIELFPRGFYQIVALRDPVAYSSRMTLRFYSLGSVTGCANTTGMTVNSSNKKGTLETTGKDPELQLKRDKFRYSNYDCDLQLNKSYFDVPIDILELYRNKINKISIKSEKYGKFIDLNLATESSKLVFSSQFEASPGVPAITVKMTFWLYPSETYVFSVPSSKTGKNIIPALKEFAKSKGLVPLEEMIKDFRLSVNAKDYYFFFDRGHTLKDKVLPKADPYLVGQMQTSRTVYGAKGPVEEPVYLDVYATTPGPQQ